MKPDFSARTEHKEAAASKIQKQWREHQENKAKKETSDETINTFKMSEEVCTHNHPSV